MIAHIESKLQEIEGGLFQKVCNLYIAAKYGITSAPGAQLGTNKTTKGTPDSYIIGDNLQYTFIEYTTQRDNIFSKIESDIEKCIEYGYDNGLPLSQIIYFHTSYPLSVDKHDALIQKCKTHNCSLIVYDISILAAELYNNYPYILKDELDINIDTGQIMPLNMFIEKYDKRKLTTPLAIDIVGREKDIENIIELIENNDVVMLFGTAGIGKTRLAIEVCKAFQDKYNSYSIYCILNEDIDLFEDYRRYFMQKKNHLIFVDDANQISSFKHLLSYIGYRPDCHFKIIATVRDYAMNKVIKEIAKNEPIGYELFQLIPLSDEQIKEICKNSFNVQNSDYLNRISEIAKGNPRLAVVASRIAIEKSLADIYDATQLMEKYYENVIEDSNINEDDMVIVACIYLLKGLYLGDSCIMEKLFNITGLTKKRFRYRVEEMHRNEIVDLCEDTAVRSSEQILSGYLAYCALLRYKYLSLSEFIIVFFKEKHERIVEGLNGLITYYRNKEVIKCFTEQINAAWNSIDQDPEMEKLYLKAFHTIRPEETMLYIKKNIEKMDSVPHEGEYVIENKYSSDINFEFQILSSYSETDQWQTAIDLIFKYIDKRQKDFSDTVKVFTEYNAFGIKEYSNRIDYREQKYIIEKVLQKTQNLSNEFYIQIFIELAKHYLNIGYNITKSSGKVFTIGEISLILSEGSKQIRALIWNTLSEIVKIRKYEQRVFDVFDNYNLRFRFNSQKNENEVAIFDKQYITKLIDSIDSDNFTLVHACYNMLSKIKWYGIDISSEVEKCLRNNAFHLFYLLIGGQYDSIKKDIKEIDKLIDADIDTTVLGYKTEQYINLIKQWDNIKLDVEKFGHDLWKINNSMVRALLTAFSIDNINFELIFEKILTMKFDINFSYKTIFIAAEKKLGQDCIQEIIHKYSKDEKLFFIRILFEIAVGDDWINGENAPYYIDLLDKYLKKEIWSNNNYYIDLRFLEYFYVFDNEIYIRTIEYLLKHDSINRFRAIHLFYKDDPRKYLPYFTERYDLLARLYFSMICIDNYADNQNKYFKCFVDEGIIDLKEYIDCIKGSSKTLYKNSNAERLSVLWELDRYNEYIDKIVSILISSNTNGIEILKNNSILESVFIGENKDTIQKQDRWIKNYVEQHGDSINKMKSILNLIGNFPIKRRLIHIQILINKNHNIELFKRIKFEPDIKSWSGSELPIIDKSIELFESIKSLLDGIDFIEHKAYIRKRIDCLKKYRRSVRISEFLRDY